MTLLNLLRMRVWKQAWAGARKNGGTKCAHIKLTHPAAFHIISYYVASDDGLFRELLPVVAGPHVVTPCALPR